MLGSALTQSGESLIKIAEMKDKMDSDAKLLFIDPLQYLVEESKKDLSVIVAVIL